MENGAAEKFLEKHRFCPKTAHSVVQKGKRKMQVFENQALAFYLVPGAEALLLLYIEV